MISQQPTIYKALGAKHEPTQDWGSEEDIRPTNCLD